MTGLDTNVLVRYLTQDDDEQFQAVLRLLSRRSAVYFVPDLALIELDWVLRCEYGWTTAEVADAIARLTTIGNLEFEDRDRLLSALYGLRQGADLADELIVRRCRDCGVTKFATFDRQILKRHKPFAISP